MIDYLNPHHVYIDAQTAPDLSVEVKRDELPGTNVGNMPDMSAQFRRDWDAVMHEPDGYDLPETVDTGANIVPETVDNPHKSARTDADKGVEIMENRINQRYGGDAETPAERIIRLYRSGMSHVDITARGFDLADIRRVISEATAKDETLYRAHKEGR